MHVTDPAFFFDLDGTILDTALDLFGAMSSVHQARQWPTPMPAFSLFRSTVYAGSPAMIDCTFGISTSHPLFNSIRREFIAQYRAHFNERTVFFDGFSDLLSDLDQQGRVWGIVTNKSEALTHPLLAHFGLADRAHCVICGDTFKQRKPHPLPIQKACEQTGQLPERAYYIGDAQSDVVAAQAAGLQAIALTYGYYALDCPPETWGAEYVVDSVPALVALIAQLSVVKTTSPTGDESI
jgi:phosphoglycolate phosphatase